MTDRIKALTVVLASNTREDDAEGVIKAIRLMRGVVSVTGEVEDLDTHVATMRVRTELNEKLLKVLYP